MVTVKNGFSARREGELRETWRERRMTFGLASELHQDYPVPMSLVAFCKRADEARCRHGHFDSGSPGMRGTYSQPGSGWICKPDPAFRCGFAGPLGGSTAERGPADRPQSATAALQHRVPGTPAWRSAGVKDRAS